MQTPVGDDFQKETKYTRNENFGGNLDWSNKPETYKSYPNSKVVRLPNQLKETTTVFTEVIRKRRSTRAFSPQPLTELDLAFLLWASTGIQRIEHGYEFRMAPVRWRVIPNRDICCSK